MSIVLELQSRAMRGDVPLAELLRMSFAVATKLKLEKFQAWTSLELNGYFGQVEVPNHRIVHGTLKALNPYRGWIPVISADGDATNTSEIPLRQSIGELHDLVTREGDYLSISAPPKLQKKLMDQNGVDFEFKYHIGKSQVVGVLDGVRNLILDWSLKLEQDGILGSEIAFSANEIATAVREAAKLQAPINIISVQNMNDSTIQQSSPKGRQRLK